MKTATAQKIVQMGEMGDPVCIKQMKDGNLRICTVSNISYSESIVFNDAIGSLGYELTIPENNIVILKAIVKRYGKSDIPLSEIVSLCKETNSSFFESVVPYLESKESESFGIDFDLLIKLWKTIKLKNQKAVIDILPSSIRVSNESGRFILGKIS